MTPKYPLSPDERPTGPARPYEGSPATTRRGKGRASRVGGIKTLLAIASVAGTVGGWAMFANHDAATATQAMAEPTAVVSLVSQLSAAPTDTATAIATSTSTSIATSTPIALATATSQAAQQFSSIAAQASTQQATATTAPATATPVPPTATATTALPAATATTQKAVPTAVTTTRSSR